MVVIDTTTDDGSSTQVGSQTRLRKYWQPMLRAPKAKPHTLSSLLSRNGSVLVLALMASGMIIWTAYYAYTYTNHPREMPVRAAEGSGQSVIVLQVSTSVTALLLSELASACYERVRWQQASSTNGVLGGSLMGLSRGTSFAGVLFLLVHPATRWPTRLWCLNRIIVYVMIFVITFILLLDLSFPTLSLVAVDWDESLVVTTGWGDFNASALQRDVLGFPGFLQNPSETLDIPSSPARCNTTGTDDTSLDQCESHLLFTGLSNMQSYDDWSSKQFVSLVKTPAFQSASSIASGFMPWIETPWAVSFYEHAFDHTFTTSECGHFHTPPLLTAMDDDDDEEEDDDYWSHPVYPDLNDVWMELCVSTLDNTVSSGTTVATRVGVCSGMECYSGIGNSDHTKRMPIPPYFHGPGNMSSLPLSLSMTITKWFATPVYSTQNGTVLSADLPVYTRKDVDSNVVLQNLGMSSASSPSDFSVPIPVSIDADDFRDFLFQPFNDIDNYGNISVKYTLPNVLLNQIVQCFATGDISEGYTLIKDFLAYSLREGSALPIAGSDPEPNISPGLWSWEETRMQISLPAWYLFIALCAAVLMSCFLIIVWTSIADHASSTTLFPEVDFGAGFMAGTGHERDHGYTNGTFNAGASASSSQTYDGLPGYEDAVDRRHCSDDDFMTHTQEQIDLVSKLRKVDSGTVVHRMAKATFKVADPS